MLWIYSEPRREQTSWFMQSIEIWTQSRHRRQTQNGAGRREKWRVFSAFQRRNRGEERRAKGLSRRSNWNRDKNRRFASSWIYKKPKYQAALAIVVSRLCAMPRDDLKARYYSKNPYLSFYTSGPLLNNETPWDFYSSHRAYGPALPWHCGYHYKIGSLTFRA